MFWPKLSRPQSKTAFLERLPLEAFPAGQDPLSPQRQVQWLWIFLAIGLAARLVRYLLRFPLWEDECMLVTNFLDRGYLDLLRPLNYCQVAPTLFLWCELTVIKLFGFSEYTLRLVPFLCGIASLFLFRHLAGLLLRGTALVVTFGIFAVAYPPIRYTAEAKPYGCDLFLALLMLTLLVHWLRRPGENRWLWGLAALIVPAVGFSFPALFIGGTVSLIVAYMLWSSDRRGVWPWLVFNGLLVGSFVVMLAINHMAVGRANQTRMEGMWMDAFPPLLHPLNLIGWFFNAHTGSMAAYPLGGPGGGSTLTFLCCVAGVVLLARRRHWFLLTLLLAPLGLNFIAAAMHRFPYGEHMKFSLYAAMTFCTLMGLGITALMQWYPWRRPLPRRSLAVVLGLLAAVATGSILHDLTQPYKSSTTLRAREFARWFWFDLAHDSELVCLETDVKANLSPGTYEWGWSALYLCNQRIYSPRHARGEAPHWERVSATWPLRCALFRSTTEERQSDALDRWLADMKRTYQLVGHDRYPFPIYGKWDRPPKTIDNYIEVFKFIPLATAAESPRVPLAGRVLGCAGTSRR